MLQAPAAIEQEWRNPQFLKTIVLLSCLSFLCLQFALSFLFTSALIIFFSARLFIQSARKLQSSGMIIFLPRCVLVYLFDKSILDALCSIYSIPKAASQCLKNFVFSIISSEGLSAQVTENQETSERKTEIFLNTLESSTKRVITTKGLLNIIPESISMAILPKDKVYVKERNISSKDQSEDDDRVSLASTNTSHSNKTQISNKIGCFLDQIAEEQEGNQQNMSVLQSQHKKTGESELYQEKGTLHENHLDIKKGSSSNGSSCLISNLEFSFNNEQFDRVSADCNTFVRSASVPQKQQEQEQQNEIGVDELQKDDLSFYQIFNNRKNSAQDNDKGQNNMPSIKLMKSSNSKLNLPQPFQCGINSISSEIESNRTAFG